LPLRGARVNLAGKRVLGFRCGRGDGPSYLVRTLARADAATWSTLTSRSWARFPAGGGWRLLGRTVGNRNSFADKSNGVFTMHGDPVRGSRYLRTAIDGPSRLACTELLADEREETAAAFWARASTWFTECGITVRKVLTDNGSCCRSRTFTGTHGGIEHHRTRPHRP
jgi:hypothetical protein